MTSTLKLLPIKPSLLLPDSLFFFYFGLCATEKSSFQLAEPLYQHHKCDVNPAKPSLQARLSSTLINATRAFKGKKNKKSRHAYTQTRTQTHTNRRKTMNNSQARTRATNTACRQRGSPVTANIIDGAALYHFLLAVVSAELAVHFSSFAPKQLEKI